MSEASPQSQNAGRFSADVYERLKSSEDELVFFASRLTHVLSVHAELIRVGREKPFLVYHAPAWNMLLAERDMIVIDLASWAKAFYRSGGFLKKLQGPDLAALSLSWSRDGSEDDRHWLKLNAEWRKKAFDRLFPNATGQVPSRQNVEVLESRLHNHFQPLLDDRNNHRAHKYECGKRFTAKMLAPAEVTGHLEHCQHLLADLRCLSSNSQFSSYDYEVRSRPDDDHAQDVVDLVFCGTMSWISQYGSGADIDTERPWYWQKRNAYYERLHAAHDGAGDPQAPFNDRSRIMVAQQS